MMQRIRRVMHAIEGRHPVRPGRTPRQSPRLRCCDRGPDRDRRAARGPAPDSNRASRARAASILRVDLVPCGAADDSGEAAPRLSHADPADFPHTRRRTARRRLSTPLHVQPGFTADALQRAAPTEDQARDPGRPPPPLVPTRPDPDAGTGQRQRQRTAKPQSTHHPPQPLPPCGTTDTPCTSKPPTRTLEEPLHAATPPPSCARDHFAPAWRTPCTKRHPTSPRPAQTRPGCMRLHSYGSESTRRPSPAPPLPRNMNPYTDTLTRIHR